MLTVILNNVAGDTRLKTAWGLSCLLEHRGESVLFDVGPDAGKLFTNMNILNIDIKRIQKIVISHSHNDHAGALRDVLKKNPGRMDLFIPLQYGRRKISEFRSLAREVYVIWSKKEVCPHTHVVPFRGVIGGENCLVIETKKGPVSLIGCAHPGIYRMASTIKKEFSKNLYALLGGFHFEYYPPFFVRVLAMLLRKEGIKFIGPNHCTGPGATEVLRKYFKEGFIDFSSGRTFQFS